MKKKNTIWFFTVVAGSIIFHAMSCNKADNEVPVIVTTAVNDITQTSASSGGRIKAYDSAKYTAIGVCWSTNEKPTIADNITSDTTSTGTFTSDIIGLSPNSKYYVRAYAITSSDTKYGREVSFTTEDFGTVTDIDDNIYKTLTIGTQTWMVENLKVIHYRNGDPIPETIGGTLWGDLITGSYCHYDNSPDNSVIYGNLYNWYAVNDSRNIAPAGWHVPFDDEWTILIDYLISNSYGYQGSGSDICKSLASRSGWTESSTVGATGYDQASNNSSGFTALPGGCRDPEGNFTYIEGYGFWWNTTGFNTDNAFYLCIYSHYYDVFRDNCSKKYGFSVRCIKN
jgi:uncharacterized protein (TIGR02145 family)